MQKLIAFGRHEFINLLKLNFLVKIDHDFKHVFPTWDNPSNMHKECVIHHLDNVVPYFFCISQPPFHTFPQISEKFTFKQILKILFSIPKS